MTFRSTTKKIVTAVVPPNLYNWGYRWQWRIRHHFRLMRDPTYPRRDMANHLSEYYPNLSLDSGSVVLDFGAHEGYFTDLCSRMGATVIAFEPNPYTYAKGMKRLRGRERVLYVNAAVSASSMWTSMYFPKDYRYAPELHSGSGTLLADNQCIDTRTSISCSALSLQLILDQSETITFVKMDIEGAERELWPTLAKNRHKIKNLAIETHERLFDDHEVWIAEASNFIREHGLENHWRLDWP